MSQQFEIFIVAMGDTSGLDALNRFLRGHRILTVDRQFDGGNWHFCVSWQPGVESDRDKAKQVSKIDYKEVLDPETFALFAHLRELRKELSGEARVPAYAIFTNEQLAAIAKARCATAADLRRIEGLGEGRLKKYGAVVLERIALYAQQQGETGANRSAGESA